jgi:hypothetical protein
MCSFENGDVIENQLYSNRSNFNSDRTDTDLPHFCSLTGQEDSLVLIRFLHTLKTSVHKCSSFLMIARLGKGTVLNVGKKEEKTHAPTKNNVLVEASKILSTAPICG